MIQFAETLGNKPSVVWITFHYIFVRNDNYDAGEVLSKRSNEYFARMVMFFEQILVMEDSDSFEVRFKITGRNSERMLGNYFSMVFPMRGFSAISGDLKDCMNQG